MYFHFSDHKPISFLIDFKHCIVIQNCSMNYAQLSEMGVLRYLSDLKRMIIKINIYTELHSRQMHFTLLLQLLLKKENIKLKSMQNHRIWKVEYCEVGEFFIHCNFVNTNVEHENLIILLTTVTNITNYMYVYFIHTQTNKTMFIY